MYKNFYIIHFWPVLQIFSKNICKSYKSYHFYKSNLLFTSVYSYKSEFTKITPVRLSPRSAYKDMSRHKIVA